MTPPAKIIDVYLEIGKKRTFAGAIDWPGWCRSAGDEQEALQALIDYGPRYARVVQDARFGFHAPADSSAFVVVERLAGNATTDFGAPDIAPSLDARLVGDIELQRFQELLEACWRAFDATTGAASGKALRSGPRGGGRSVEGVLLHVLGGEAAYLGALGWKFKRNEEAGLNQQMEQIRQAALDGLAAAARGEIAALGPRGGIRWSPRYFVRRVAWHELDHAWEIEDRVIEGETP